MIVLAILAVKAARHEHPNQMLFIRTSQPEARRQVALNCLTQLEIPQRDGSPRIGHSPVSAPVHVPLAVFSGGPIPWADEEIRILERRGLPIIPYARCSQGNV